MKQDVVLSESEGASILLAIKCTAYNHEAFIRQSLDGFVMQQTNFKFIAIVHDDASTDGTTAIIREYADKYPDIIKPIYETENQYSKRDGSLDRIINEAIDATNCKYVAICEGDDYWIDPLKLQKQVDFMESHKECTLTYTSFKIYREETRTYENYQCKDISFVSKTVMMNSILDNICRIQTVTVLYRRDAFNRILESNSVLFKPGYFMMGDTQLWCALLNLGTANCIEAITSVYREHFGSACRQIDLKKRLRFNLSCDEMRLCVAKEFNLNLLKRKKRYLIALIKNFSVNPSFIPTYNPYPIIVRYAKLFTTFPFVRNIIISYIK